MSAGSVMMPSKGKRKMLQLEMMKMEEEELETTFTYILDPKSKVVSSLQTHN